MKNRAGHNIPLTIRARTNFLVALILFANFSCTPRYLAIPVSVEGIKPRDEFISSRYNHFEGGVFFADVEFGLNVLWSASFKKNNVYKENLAFFVPGGLLISPNRENTCYSAKLGALPKQLKEGKLFVLLGDTFLEVLGIIHTHPDIYSEPMPAPKYDYQFCYLGIHNYVMDHHNLFEAYKDSSGRELYKRLGHRTAYYKIPFVCPLRNPSVDLETFQSSHSFSLKPTEI